MSKSKPKVKVKSKAKPAKAKPKARVSREPKWFTPRKYQSARAGSTLAQIVEFVTKHPRFTTNELRAALRKGRNLLGMPLCGLTRRGMLTRTGRGTYLCPKVSALPEVRAAA